jgi:UDP-N-acetylglucosamine pyrophosphorylase
MCLQSLLNSNAMLKLNGGLGTSMGLEKAKSLLKVKDGKTFLDIICQQVKFMREQFKSALTFILMDSFSSSADTRAFLATSFPDMLSEPFIELMSPKVDVASMEAASYEPSPDMEW